MNIEWTILSSAIMNEGNLAELCQCDVEIFTEPQTRQIFYIIKSLYESDIRPDAPMIGYKLEKFNDNGTVNGILVRLMEQPPCMNFSELLRELINNNYKKIIRASAKDLYDNVLCGDLKFIDFLDKITELSEKIVSNRDNGFFRVDDEKIDLIEHYKKVSYVKTGYKPIDDVIRGFFKKQLITIAGRPGLGKTTFALNIAKNISLNDGRCVYISLEMGHDELYSKLIASEANISAGKIETSSYFGDDHKRCLLAQEKIKKCKIDIFDKKLDFRNICSIISRYKGKSALIIIDYLQLITGAKGENQNIRIGNITTRLKQLARDNEIPIIILSQLSRDIERTSREPVLSDLRDSGSIEQDSDVVIFLYESDELGFSDYTPIIAKNRKGKIGKIKGIEFIKEFSKIT